MYKWVIHKKEDNVKILRENFITKITRILVCFYVNVSIENGKFVKESSISVKSFESI